MAKYYLWSKEDIKEIKKTMIGMDTNAKMISRKIIEIIDVANAKHNEKMIEKELEYLHRLVDRKPAVGCEDKCQCPEWNVNENNICNICRLEGCDE